MSCGCHELNKKQFNTMDSVLENPSEKTGLNNKNHKRKIPVYISRLKVNKRSPHNQIPTDKVPTDNFYVQKSSNFTNEIETQQELANKTINDTIPDPNIKNTQEKSISFRESETQTYVTDPSIPQRVSQPKVPISEVMGNFHIIQPPCYIPCGTILPGSNASSIQHCDPYPTTTPLCFVPKDEPIPDPRVDFSDSTSSNSFTSEVLSHFQENPCQQEQDYSLIPITSADQIYGLEGPLTSRGPIKYEIQTDKELTFEELETIINQKEKITPLEYSQKCAPSMYKVRTNDSNLDLNDIEYLLDSNQQRPNELNLQNITTQTDFTVPMSSGTQTIEDRTVDVKLLTDAELANLLMQKRIETPQPIQIPPRLIKNDESLPDRGKRYIKEPARHSVIPFFKLARNSLQPGKITPIAHDIHSIPHYQSRFFKLKPSDDVEYDSHIRFEWSPQHRRPKPVIHQTPRPVLQGESRVPKKHHHFFSYHKKKQPLRSDQIIRDTGPQ